MKTCNQFSSFLFDMLLTRKLKKKTNKQKNHYKIFRVLEIRVIEKKNVLSQESTLIKYEL